MTSGVLGFPAATAPLSFVPRRCRTVRWSASNQYKLDQIDPDMRSGCLLPDGSNRRTSHALAFGVRGGLAGLAAPSGLAATIAQLHGLGRLRVPLPWSEIQPDSVVLARAERDEGWWEWRRAGGRGKAVWFACRWRDYPDEPFRRSVNCVWACCRPAASGEAGTMIGLDQQAPTYHMQSGRRRLLTSLERFTAAVVSVGGLARAAVRL